MIGRPRDRILLFRAESRKNHSGPGFETANNFNDDAMAVAVAFEAIAGAAAVAFIYYCCVVCCFKNSTIDIYVYVA